MKRNLAENLFHDIILSRSERNILFFPFIGGWMIFHFYQKNNEDRIFFKMKNGSLVKGDFSQKFFLRVLNNFLLKGDFEKICKFLKTVNLQKNRGSGSWFSKRGGNMVKELVMNFLLYRLSYERRRGLEIFLEEVHHQNFQPGHFYLAKISPRLKDTLGGFVLSLSYCFPQKENEPLLVFKSHLPHLHVHSLVRDALRNIGIIIG